MIAAGDGPPSPDTEAPGASAIDQALALTDEVLNEVRSISPVATVFLLMARHELTTLAVEQRGQLIRTAAHGR